MRDFTAALVKGMMNLTFGYRVQCVRTLQSFQPQEKASCHCTA